MFLIRERSIRGRQAGKSLLSDSQSFQPRCPFYTSAAILPQYIPFINTFQPVPSVRCVPFMYIINQQNSKWTPSHQLADSRRKLNRTKGRIPCQRFSVKSSCKGNLSRRNRIRWVSWQLTSRNRRKPRNLKTVAVVLDYIQSPGSDGCVFSVLIGAHPGLETF